MSSESYALRARDLSKAYRIWKDPSARLKYPLFRAVGRALPAAIRPASWSPASDGQDHGYYHDFFALRGLTFEIHRGEMVGIMGRNGSGKSTLLQILAGTLRPSAGEFRTVGKVAALLELGSGFNPDFTGRENALLNAAILGLNRAEAHAKLDEILAFADIGEFVDQPVKTFSSGMMIRLAFAVQTAITPDILIVDEALSVGDEAFQRKCYARIQSLRERGATVLLVSHSSAQVIELCSRAMLLHKGELLLDGDPATVVKQYHRVIYSPAGKQAEILRRLREGLCSEDLDEGGEDAAASPAGLASGPALDPEPNDESFFDDKLVSTSRVEYASEGVLVSDPVLFNARNERVNVLSSGIQYRLRYHARIERDVFRVIFGTLLQTKTGLEITGFRTPADHPPCEHMVPGQEVVIDFRFRCLLAAGTYFFNAGAEGQMGEERGFLHRIVDSLAIRVLPEKSGQNAGMTRLFDQVHMSIR